MKSLWALVILAGIPFVAHAEEWVCCNEAEVLLNCGGVAGLDDEYCACYCDVHPDDSRCAVTTMEPETTLDGGKESDCPEGQTYIKAAYTGDDELLDGTGICCSNVVSITNLGNYEGGYANVDQICCDNPTSNTEAICDMGGIVGTESGTPETSGLTLPPSASSPTERHWRRIATPVIRESPKKIPFTRFPCRTA